MSSAKYMLKVALIALSIMMIPVGAFALFNGSLEMMPTPEQIEKTRIAAVLFLVVGTLSAAIGLKIRPKKC